MELSSNLLRILVCPVTGGTLVYDRENKELISEAAGLVYPIVDGIPILLLDKARKIAKKSTTFESEAQKEHIATEDIFDIA